MILCAGLGSRLRPLTERRPKPLVPVGDRSVLSAICGQLAGAGYRSAVVNTHHAAGEFDSILGSYEVSLTAIHEAEILGGAGGVKAAQSLLAAPTIVWNGDILLSQPPLAALQHELQSGAALCLAVAPPGTGQPGTLGLDSGGRVVRLRGEKFGAEARAADYVGLMGLSGELLESLPTRGCLIADVCLPRLRAGQTVATVAVPGGWWDIGTPAHYARANFDWLRQRGQLNWTHASAQIASAVALSDCVVGEGASVGGSGRLERVIVWPGAAVRAPLCEAIVTPTHTVKLGPLAPLAP